MPALVNIGANLILGAAMVLVARRSPALRAHTVSWSLLMLLGFEAIVFTPVATYLFRFYPQWSMFYWFDPQLFPDLQYWIGWLSFLAVLLNFAAALGAYTLARYGVLYGRAWAYVSPLLAGGLLIVGAAVLFGQRIAFVGDYDEFWQGSARLIVITLAGWLGVLSYAAAGVFIYWIGRRFGARDPSLL